MPRITLNQWKQSVLNRSLDLRDILKNADPSLDRFDKYDNEREEIKLLIRLAKIYGYNLRKDIVESP